MNRVSNFCNLDSCDCFILFYFKCTDCFLKPFDTVRLSELRLKFWRCQSFILISTSNFFKDKENSKNPRKMCISWLNLRETPSQTPNFPVQSQKAKDNLRKPVILFLNNLAERWDLPGRLFRNHLVLPTHNAICEAITYISSLQMVLPNKCISWNNSTNYLYL